MTHHFSTTNTNNISNKSQMTKVTSNMTIHLININHHRLLVMIEVMNHQHQIVLLLNKSMCNQHQH